MSKLTKTILSISAAVIAVAGVVVLVLHFWDDLKALCPCCRKNAPKDDMEDDFVMEE